MEWTRKRQSKKRQTTPRSGRERDRVREGQTTPRSGPERDRVRDGQTTPRSGPERDRVRNDRRHRGVDEKETE